MAASVGRILRAPTCGQLTCDKVETPAPTAGLVSAAEPAARGRGRILIILCVDKKLKLNTLSSRLSTQHSSPLCLTTQHSPSSNPRPTPHKGQSSLSAFPSGNLLGDQGGYLISGYLAQSSAFAGCGAAAIGRLWTLRKRPFKRDGREAHVLTSTAAPAPVAVRWVGALWRGAASNSGI